VSSFSSDLLLFGDQYFGVRQLKPTAKNIITFSELAGALMHNILFQHDGLHKIN